MIRHYVPSKALLTRSGLSERRAVALSGVSRQTIREISSGGRCTLRSLEQLAESLERDVEVMFAPKEVLLSEYSTLGAAMGVLRDGFESWKIHLFNFVDEFRRTLDPRLLILPPPSSFEPKLKALLASIVSALCEEAQISTPTWAERRYFLIKPWFVSETECLKAMAILESPLAFRKNNIFVLNNFLART